MTIVMFRRLAVAAWLAIAAAAWGHPAGKFSVNHYTRLTALPAGVGVRHVIEWAEAPTLETARRWNVRPGAPASALAAPAAAEMRARLPLLRFLIDGHELTPNIIATTARWGSGDGGRPTLRLEADLHLDTAPGALRFFDGADPDRGGWREIVITAGPGVALEETSAPGEERSRELTVYPHPESMPRDLAASLIWEAGAAGAPPLRVPPPAAEPPPAAPSPAAAPGPPPAAAAASPLAALLEHGELTAAWAAWALLIAFGYGAAHALSPGHGKTIVAAYLVGSRGTLRHALLLGAMVTFTHTISVFALGAVTLFLAQYILPDQMARTLRLASGLSIAAVGAWLLLRRMGLAGADHSHEPPAGLGEGAVTPGALLALAASGGLIPCPSALVLLLTAVAVNRTGFGLLLLVAFSLGLAGVLTAIGAAVVFAKGRLPRGASDRFGWLFRVAPVLSALVILGVGVGMTGLALGWWNVAWLGE